MEDLGERGLFRAEWDSEFAGIMTAIAQVDVAVVSATGSVDGWVFELHAGTTDPFADFRKYCREHDINAAFTRLTRLSETTTGAEYNLTPEQREALVLAFDEGYYEEPWETTLEALASQLDISRPAFSARLRRGYRNLIESTLVYDRREKS